MMKVVSNIQTFKNIFLFRFLLKITLSHEVPTFGNFSW